MLTMILYTWREMLHRRVLAVTLLMVVAFLVLYGLAVRQLALHSGDLDPLAKSIVIPQIFSAGLYFGSFIVSFLAVFSALGAVSGEVENGTVYGLVATPVRRAEILLGKFLGYALALVVYAALFFLAIGAIVRGYTSLAPGGQGGALALFCLQPLVLLAVTVLGSTLLPTLANGILMFMLYAVAMVGGMLEQIGWLLHVQSLQQIGIISSLIMPVDALYRKIVYILLTPTATPLQALTQMGPFGAQVEPSVWMLVYTIAYLLVAVALAVRNFNRRDF
ncbi:ABC transporter permease subunit [Desulfotomaculum copahuensis]|uniref:ABC transporter permease n=1 Tax=Desulfotomaculum copahuensis TaxID=1838280 RepID=A0A1B7LBT2_9FIRM|nr:ABC transporter permease subunit [Desulfotomaculum copahuensis]OAT79950.1 hypothetical protein A6M21_14180 [Desulfotomaculum copahuensis]